MHSFCCFDGYNRFLFTKNIFSVIYQTTERMHITPYKFLFSLYKSNMKLGLDVI